MELRWTVPYTLVSGYASNARVWATDAADAKYRASVVIARGGCPAVQAFGEPVADPWVVL
jgi:hypothetical protein